MKYDQDNLFRQIIDGKISSKKIYEDEYLLAFYDAYPVAPVHILIIPKTDAVNYQDFIMNTTPEVIAYFFKKIAEIARDSDIADYRLITNNGQSAGQTIMHFHMHLISGKNLTKLVADE